MTKRLKLPYGFQDVLPEECSDKNLLENRLSMLYEAYGYNKIETPTIEYYDTFHDVYAPEKLKKMFKLTDNDGSLLVLRPDITLQICRMASKLDLSTPQRLFYSENCFEYLDSRDTARTREFSQIGIELLGESGVYGDIEIINLAIESFLKAGLNDFIIEIGDNRFFKGLVSDSGLNEKDIAELTLLINKKDGLGMEIFLQEKQIKPNFIEKFLLMPTLFGKKEVFNQARSITTNSLAYEALERMERIYEALEKVSYDKYIAIDLGMLHGLNYYSGLVLKGYSENLGLCLLDGGRYDKLCQTFGYPSEAVGFAIGTKRLLKVTDSEKLIKQKDCHYVYFSDDKSFATEFHYVTDLRKRGFKVVKLFCKSEEDLIEYCNRYSIKKAFFIVNNSVSEISMEAV